jgi:hypothetical protein
MRYRLRTLLLFTFLAALVCLALRSPSRAWSAGLFAALVAVLLTAVLVAIYRAGQARAMAIGFCVFSIGYLLIEGRFVPGTGANLTLPTAELIDWSYNRLHLEEDQRQLRAQFAADDPFAPTVQPARHIAHKGICIATLATIFGLIGAGIAQQLERVRNTERTPK